MTEVRHPPTTHIAPSSQIPSSAVNPIPAQDIVPKVEVQEEEPYTIKCICDYSDDDGDTIQCDDCDTWQHIHCFYTDPSQDLNGPEFAHYCTDCRPRPLDKHAARERQRLRRLNTGPPDGTPVLHAVVPKDVDAGDKKAKRPPTKNHKKKIKPTDLQLNGTSSGHEGVKHASPSDSSILPPPKKPKTSHKPSPSVSSQAAKRSPPLRASLNGHPPSPATTPPDLPTDLELQGYSRGFRPPSYNEQPVQTVRMNSWADLSITNTIRDWLTDPAKMKAETGHEYHDVFRTLPPNRDLLSPPCKVGTKVVRIPADHERQVPALMATKTIESDYPIIELNGTIGVQRDYCANQDNRWEELSTPLPFVFFHPELPVYIDTRREGSLARYVRRSCKPNAVLDTFLSKSPAIGASDCHIWLVSDRRIEENEQITIAWDFRIPPRMLRFLGLGDEAIGPHQEADIDFKEYSNIATWLNLILSEYGGCGCDLGEGCAFWGFRQLGQNKWPSAKQPTTKRRQRKPKAHTISPTSTGQATNSRAPSEGRMDDAAETDGHSVEESRSKPASRETTPPVRQGSFDTFGIITEPTDRDRRKVQMVEDTFRRMEQGQQAHRKKKRNSDGNSTSTATSSKPKSTSKNAASQSTSTHNGEGYVDAGTSRQGSASPSTALSPSTVHPATQPSRQTSVLGRSRHGSVAARPNYCDASTQTNPEDGQWYSQACSASRPKKRVVSLAKKLLNSRYKLRQEGSSGAYADSHMFMSVRMDVDGAAAAGALDPSSQHALVSPSLSSSGDANMTDAPGLSPSVQTFESGTSPTLVSPGKPKMGDLVLQMPPVPAFPSASPTGTPLSATASMVQSPFAMGMPSPFAPPAVNGIAAHPSPVKKKMSLSDYTNRKNKVSARAPTLSASSSTLNGDSTIPESPIVERSESTNPTPSGMPPPA